MVVFRFLVLYCVDDHQHISLIPTDLCSFMSANRLHASNLSTSLLSWLVSSASQTVRRSLRVSVRMRTRSAEGIQTNGWKPRYETFIVDITRIIWWKCVNLQPNHRPVCASSHWVYFLQMEDSEEDSDVDTGFYSDGETASPPKRRSLLVALRYVHRIAKVHMFMFSWTGTDVLIKLSVDSTVATSPFFLFLVCKSHYCLLFNG